MHIYVAIYMCVSMCVCVVQIGKVPIIFLPFLTVSWSFTHLG